MSRIRLFCGWRESEAETAPAPGTFTAIEYPSRDGVRNWRASSFTDDTGAVVRDLELAELSPNRDRGVAVFANFRREEQVWFRVSLTISVSPAMGERVSGSFVWRLDANDVSPERPFEIDGFYSTLSYHDEICLSPYDVLVPAISVSEGGALVVNSLTLSLVEDG